MPRVLDPLQFVMIALAGWMNQRQLQTLEYLREENRGSARATRRPTSAIQRRPATSIGSQGERLGTETSGGCRHACYTGDLVVGGCPGKLWLPQKNVANPQDRRTLAGPISVRHLDSMSLPGFQNKTPQARTAVSSFGSRHPFRFSDHTRLLRALFGIRRAPAAYQACHSIQADAAGIVSTVWHPS